MQLQDTKEREFNNIVEYLLREVPEFSNRYDHDPEDGEYLVFGDFARFIIEQMENNKVKALKCSFNFINRRITLPDYRVKNLFEVQLFEVFLEDEKYKKFSKQYLKGEASKSFKNMESQTNNLRFSCR